MGLQLIHTGDGVHTLYDPMLDEVYHSRNGAMAESIHVFVKAGLEEALQSFDRIRLLEVGFGTGLNALLTAVAALDKNVHAEYHTTEPFPLEDELVRRLNHASLVPGATEEMWSAIHGCPWGQLYPVNEFFHLMKIRGKVEEQSFAPGLFNLVYFDAFSPGVQTELWEEDVFRKINTWMENNGILVTYSARGAVRRNLISAGFSVERLPGPAGKREMLRAVKSAGDPE